MAHQNNCLLFTQRFYAFPEKFLCHFCVNSWKGIVKNINVRILVKGSGKNESCLLSSWKGYPLLPDHSLVLLGQNLEVVLEARLCDCFVVLSLVELSAKNDVVLDGVWEENGFLLNVGNWPLDRKRPLYGRAFIREWKSAKDSSLTQPLLWYHKVCSLRNEKLYLTKLIFISPFWNKYCIIQIKLKKLSNWIFLNINLNFSLLFCVFICWYVDLTSV